MYQFYIYFITVYNMYHEFIDMIFCYAFVFLDFSYFFKYAACIGTLPPKYWILLIAKNNSFFKYAASISTLPSKYGILLIAKNNSFFKYAPSISTLPPKYRILLIAKNNSFLKYPACISTLPPKYQILLIAKNNSFLKAFTSKNGMQTDVIVTVNFNNSILLSKC